jgi:hypothetical protein
MPNSHLDSVGRPRLDIPMQCDVNGRRRAAREDDACNALQR